MQGHYMERRATDDNTSPEDAKRHKAMSEQAWQSQLSHNRWQQQHQIMAFEVVSSNTKETLLNESQKQQLKTVMLDEHEAYNLKGKEISLRGEEHQKWARMTSIYKNGEEGAQEAILSSHTLLFSSALFSFLSSVIPLE